MKTVLVVLCSVLAGALSTSFVVLHGFARYYVREVYAHRPFVDSVWSLSGVSTTKALLVGVSCCLVTLSSVVVAARVGRRNNAGQAEILVALLSIALLCICGLGAIALVGPLGF